MKIKKEYGYISYFKSNNTFKVTEFIVYSEFRGKGYARKLAEFLPKSCFLYACPLTNDISEGNLIKFYESLGFCIGEDKDNKLIMRRI